MHTPFKAYVHRFQCWALCHSFRCVRPARQYWPVRMLIRIGTKRSDITRCYVHWHYFPPKGTLRAVQPFTYSRLNHSLSLFTKETYKCFPVSGHCSALDGSQAPISLVALHCLCLLFCCLSHAISTTWIYSRRNIKTFSPDLVWESTSLISHTSYGRLLYTSTNCVSYQMTAHHLPLTIS